MKNVDSLVPGLDLLLWRGAFLIPRLRPENDSSALITAKNIKEEVSLVGKFPLLPLAWRGLILAHIVSKSDSEQWLRNYHANKFKSSASLSATAAKRHREQKLLLSVHAVKEDINFVQNKRDDSAAH